MLSISDESAGVLVVGIVVVVVVVVAFVFSTRSF